MSHISSLRYIYGALLQQGGLYLPHADSGRIIIGAWWLLVIGQLTWKFLNQPSRPIKFLAVLVTTYCGNLVAFLTFPKIDIQVKTVAELVASRGKINWGMRSGTYLEEYIKDTDVEKYQILNQDATFYPDENEKIIQDVRKGSFV